MVVEVAPTETAGVRFGFTTIVTLLLLAVAEVTHASFDVSTQVIASLLASALSTYVALLVPTFTLFFFH